MELLNETLWKKGLTTDNNTLTSTEWNTVVSKINELVNTAVLREGTSYLDTNSNIVISAHLAESGELTTTSGNPVQNLGFRIVEDVNDAIAKNKYIGLIKGVRGSAIRGGIVYNLENSDTLETTSGRLITINETTGDNLHNNFAALTDLPLHVRGGAVDIYEIKNDTDGRATIQISKSTASPYYKNPVITFRNNGGSYNTMSIEEIYELVQYFKTGAGAANGPWKNQFTVVTKSFNSAELEQFNSYDNTFTVSSSDQIASGTYYDYNFIPEEWTSNTVNNTTLNVRSTVRVIVDNTTSPGTNKAAIVYNGTYGPTGMSLITINKN